MSTKLGSRFFTATIMDKDHAVTDRPCVYRNENRAVAIGTSVEARGCTHCFEMPSMPAAHCRRRFRASATCRSVKPPRPEISCRPLSESMKSTSHAAASGVPDLRWR